MRFLVDEQLPFLLADWLRSKGYEADHVSSLFSGNRIPDGYICERSMLEQRIVVTKDSDFLDTFIVKQQPHKLVYLTAGNLKNRQLLDLFRANWSVLCDLLATAHVIELNQQTMKVWF